MGTPQVEVVMVDITRGIMTVSIVYSAPEVEFFSWVYQPQDTPDEKVSSVLPRREHGEIEPLDPSGIR